MNPKLLIVSLATLGLGAAAQAAHAAPAGAFSLGAEVQILPVGEFAGEANSLDLGTSFGLLGIADYAVHRNVSIGLAPRLVFGMKPDDADSEDEDSASQIDFAARVTAHGAVAPRVDLFGYLSPGYSVIMLPGVASDTGIEDPTGLVLGIGGGAAFQIAPRISLTGDIGYTFGFQSTDFDDESVDFASNLLHVGVGVKAAL